MFDPYDNANDKYGIDEIIEETQTLTTGGPGLGEDLMSTKSEVAKQIMFATQMTSAKSDYYLRGDPVSLIITNIPSFKGGRANPWMEADENVIAVRDAKGQSIRRKDMEDSF